MTKRYAQIKSSLRPSGQNRHMYRGRDGQPIEKTKAKRAGVYFSVSISTTRRQYNTGFWETITNPWFGAKRRLPEGFTEEVLKLEDITIQDYLEIKYNHPRGYYTSDTEKRDKSTAIQDFAFLLEEGSNILNLEFEKDEVMFFLAKQSPKIANSKAELNTAIHQFYISSVDEDALEEIKKFEVIEEALALNARIKSELPSDSLKRLAVVLGHASTDMNELGIKASIFQALADANNQDQLKNCKEFSKIGIELFGDKLEKERFATRYFLQQLFNSRILALNTNRVIWVNAPSPELSQIGNSKASALSWMLDPNNKDHVDALKKELQEQTGIKFK